jgi:hypothetical protein
MSLGDSEGLRIRQREAARPGWLKSRRDAAQGLLFSAASFGLVMLPRSAGAGVDGQQAVKNVLLVRDSCQQLEEDLTNGRYPDVRAVTKSLIRNYRFVFAFAHAYTNLLRRTSTHGWCFVRLKEALEGGLKLVDAGRRDQANQKGKAALEDLFSIIEVSVAP